MEKVIGIQVLKNLGTTFVSSFFSHSSTYILILSFLRDKSRSMNCPCLKCTRFDAADKDQAFDDAIKKVKSE